MVNVDEILSAMKECYDPEIPVNIVDLGLVYDVQINDANVHVKMTLTAPGCAMGGMIAQDVKNRIEQIEGVKEASVEMVFDPPWSPEKMSDAAKKQLGFA